MTGGQSLAGVPTHALYNRIETFLPQGGLKKKLSSSPLQHGGPPNIEQNGVQSDGGGTGWGLFGQKAEGPILVYAACGSGGSWLISVELAKFGVAILGD